jgi:hypothetical protein
VFTPPNVCWTPLITQSAETGVEARSAVRVTVSPSTGDAGDQWKSTAHFGSVSGQPPVTTLTVCSVLRCSLPQITVSLTTYCPGAA